MALEALIFDVDGTLADTEEVHRTAFNRAFEHFALGWNWDPARYRALLDITGGKERIRRHIASLSPNAAERSRLEALVAALHEEKTRQYGALLGDGAVTLRPGVHRLLEEGLSAGCKLAIASTTTAANIDALLQSTLGSRGLDMFSVIACGDQVRAKKPAPDVYRLALHGLGLHPEHAVAFEDSGHGVRSAVAARLYTVVTPNFWTVDGDFSGAALRLPHLGDPDHPLPGEPGGALSGAAWLTLDELERRHAAIARSTAIFPTELSP
jgi:beta-phosphoglucomutase-like phosphatase (HAD superfamily)